MLVATAGHIDHGKTALIRALTGVETDRLPEEKARGISIDLGFAYWPQPDGRTIGFVDVPGHERFVRNMVAGICGVDLALIVVAADDGVMPQTIEHVQILDLLGVERALVAITKRDRVGAERAAEVRREVGALLFATRFAGAPISEASPVTGAGLPQLAAALTAAMAGEAPTAIQGRHFRLAIDRLFSVTGAGTVVTGTVLAGAVRVGDRMMVSPAGKPVRVRGLQSAGRAVEEAQAGERCALNLAGVDLAEVRRGDYVIAPEMHAPTTRIEARVKALGAPLRHNSKHHFHLRTADLVARVLIPGQAPITPGADGIVHLVLDDPTSAVAGEHFVLRDPSARHLVGGGTVIDPLAPHDRRRRSGRSAVTAALELAEPARVLAALLAIRGHEVDVRGFERGFNLTQAATQALFAAAEVTLLGKGGLALPKARVEAVGAQVAAALGTFHAERPDLAGLAVGALRARIAEPVSAEALASILKDMSGRGLVALAGSLARVPGHAAVFTPAETATWHDLRAWIGEAPPGPFTIEDAMRETRIREVALKAVLYRRCVNGDLFRMDERRFMLREHIAALADVAATLGPGFSAGEFRDASGIGRNMVIRILEYFDAAGITQRDGDGRRMAPGHADVAG